MDKLSKFLTGKPRPVFRLTMGLMTLFLIFIGIPLFVMMGLSSPTIFNRYNAWVLIMLLNVPHMINSVFRDEWGCQGLFKKKKSNAAKNK